jgi:exodeoxyribonuclease VII small subunit
LFPPDRPARDLFHADIHPGSEAGQPSGVAAMAKQNFEEAMARLEKITRELEAGELSLEQSLKKFDEGIRLTEFCRKTLDEAEKKVEILLQKNGEIVAEPFSGPNEE